MTLLTVIVITFVFAGIIWLADTVFHMKQPFLNVLTYGLIIVIIVCWCSFFGVFDYLSSVNVPKLHK